MNSPRQGQAAVYRVVSELILRGFNVALPCVDDHGVDIYADGIRIQVKSAYSRFNHVYTQGAYWFKLTHGAIVTGGNTIRKRGGRQFSAQCDFVIFMGIDEQRFWIVPAAMLDRTTLVTLFLGPDGFHKRQDFEEAKRLSAEGLTQQEIGDRLGISQVAVSYQLRGGRKEKPKATMSSRVRELENRWDLITTALATPREVTRILATAKTSVIPEPVAE
jgi:hypothetical protein